MISWPEHQTLNARVAIGVTPTGATAPISGSVEVAFATQTELAERTVILTEAAARVLALPVGGHGAGGANRGRIKTAVAVFRRKRVPSATVVMSLREAEAEKAARRCRARQHAAAHLRQRRPASLVVFDGEPVLAPITARRFRSR